MCSLSAPRASFQQGAAQLCRVIPGCGTNMGRSANAIVHCRPKSETQKAPILTTRRVSVLRAGARELLKHPPDLCTYIQYLGPGSIGSRALLDPRVQGGPMGTLDPGSRVPGARPVDPCQDPIRSTSMGFWPRTEFKKKVLPIPALARVVMCGSARYRTARPAFRGSGIGRARKATGSLSAEELKSEDSAPHSSAAHLGPKKEKAYRI